MPSAVHLATCSSCVSRMTAVHLTTRSSYVSRTSSIWRGKARVCRHAHRAEHELKGTTPNRQAQGMMGTSHGSTETPWHAWKHHTILAGTRNGQDFPQAHWSRLSQRVPLCSGATYFRWKENRAALEFSCPNLAFQHTQVCIHAPTHRNSYKWKPGHTHTCGICRVHLLPQVVPGPLYLAQKVLDILSITLNELQCVAWQEVQALTCQCTVFAARTQFMLPEHRYRCQQTNSKQWEWMFRGHSVAIQPAKQVMALNHTWTNKTGMRHDILY